MDEPKTHKAYADSLRALADFYEAHPEVPLPGEEHYNYAVNTDEDARNVAKALKSFNKKYTDDMFTMSKKFGTLEARFVFYRTAICKSKVVGVKTIPAELVPAREAYTVPAKTVDILEWDCGSLLEPPAVESEPEVPA